ncbi:MAG: hypothetical protein V9E82_08045, partial [Candidatus Nanopelagicales bacterium]
MTSSLRWERAWSSSWVVHGEISVVITLRAIGSILPSAWQQQVKSGMTMRYEQWLEKILADEASSIE